MNIISLFPTSVGVFNLNRELTFAEEYFIFNLPKKANLENKSSVNSYVLKSEVLNNLQIFFKKSLDEYFELVYNPSTDCSLNITQSWCNYTEYQQGHFAHTHDNSIVSGVFYVKTGESDKINFMKNATHRHSLQINQKQANFYNAESWWLPATQYSLLLFPSNLSHEVPTVYTKEPRISMSFNTFYSGAIGSRENLTELILP